MLIIYHNLIFVGALLFLYNLVVPVFIVIVVLMLGLKTLNLNILSMMTSMDFTDCLLHFDITLSDSHLSGVL